MKPKTSFHFRSFLALSGSTLLVVNSVNATQFWDGTGLNANWDNAANWGGDLIPAFSTTAINFGSLSSAAGTAFGNVVVPSQTTANNDLTAGTTIKGITFGNTGVANRTAAYTLSGNSIILGVGTNDGIVTTAITAGGAAIQDIISLNIDLGSGAGAQNRVFNIGVNHNLKVDGIISGSSTTWGLMKQGLGALTLTSTDNSYLGFTNIAGAATTVGNSVLEVTKLADGGLNSSIGAASSSIQFSLAVNGGHTNTLRHIGSANSSTNRGIHLGGNVATGTNSAIESSGDGTLSFTSSSAITFTNSGVPRNLYLGGTNAGNNVFNLALSNNGAGLSTITKQGDGKWINSGTHTYTGATTISAGTMQFAKQVSLYNNNTAGAGWTAANIIVAGTGTLALNVGGLTGEFTTGNVTTLLTNLGGANGTSTTGFAAGSKIGFDTTNADGGSFTVGDVIADSTGAGGGAIGLTKLGAGALVLSNSANTYTGATTITGGTLEVSGAGGALTGTSGVSINGGTLLLSGGTENSRIADGATVTLGGGATATPRSEFKLGNTTAVTEKLGALSLTTGTSVRVIDFGGNAGSQLTFASLSGGVDATLQVWNWTENLGADQLIITSGTADGGMLLSNVNFYSGDNTGSALGGGGAAFIGNQLVPVPEPGALVSAAALGMAAFFRRRRTNVEG